jgi:hypothetical protein
MMQADQTMHDRVVEAIRDDLVKRVSAISEFAAVADNIPAEYRIGDIEDLNVLVQNSLWLHVPVGYLDAHEQVKSLRDRAKWADNQVEQILLIRKKFDELAGNVEAICV